MSQNEEPPREVESSEGGLSPRKVIQVEPVEIVNPEKADQAPEIVQNPI